ncbi:unnamed protein product [Dibothriocephalus latus]|uniref:C6H2-type domain-containing protein n=1 Tax=Dibothriocephalus latus TaxID=60516 RepID=A0A3P7P4K9_DIBLA|nr:unnamed protein product [Dibothriocephalus latus]
MPNVCVTPDCGKTATLRCPTCVKLGITGSYFCNQVRFINLLFTCFRNASKNTGKHTKTCTFSLGKITLPESEYDSVFSGYRFTGSLRPGKKFLNQYPDRITPKLVFVPNLFTSLGIPISENDAKRSHTIVTLSDEEMEGMRTTGRLAREVLDAAINAVAVGVTTDEIDRIVHEAILLIYSLKEFVKA